MFVTFTTASGADIRVQFRPPPTGTPHVGQIRMVSFNWAYARHTDDLVRGEDLLSSTPAAGVC